MILRNTLILSIIALITVSSVGFCATSRTPPGSFLRHRVSSTSDLVNQVQNDKVVGLRYRNFYHTDRDKVVDVFKGLRLIPLPETRKLRVYYYDAHGRVVSEARTIRKGTPVFVDIYGNPVLEVKCGNPVATKLPEVKVSQALPPPPVSSFTVTPDVFPAVPELPPFPPTETTFAEFMVPGQPAAAEAALPEVLARHGRSFPFIPFWWPDDDDDHPPVPEPVSLVLSGIGPAGLGIYRRFARGR